MTVDINLDGKPKTDGESDFKPVLVSEDVHEGTVKEVVVLEGANYESGATEKKVVFNVELQDGIVSKWCSPKVTKGSGTYSSSAVFTILEKAKLLEDIAQFVDSIMSAQDQEEQLAKYLNGRLAGKKCKVLTKTVTKKDGSGKYSKIDKFISFE